MEEMVSVIIPTYNREKYIERAVQSILRQTYDRYEIIIVDDGSTDNTWEIIQKLEEIDRRIRYIKLEKNQGPEILGCRKQNMNILHFWIVMMNGSLISWNFRWAR